MDSNEIRDIEQLKRSAPNYVDAFMKIPYDNRTEEVCMVALRLDLNCIRDIPEASFTMRVVECILNKDERFFRHLPDQIITEELCKEYIQKYPHMLDLIPFSKRSKDICQIAIDKVGDRFMDHFEFIPSIPHIDILAACLKKYPHFNSYILQNMNPQLQDKNFVELAMSISADAFPFIENRWKDEQMCLQAVKKKPDYIQFIPENKRTREVCEIVAASGILNLGQYIPYPCADLCKELVECSDKRFSLPIGDLVEVFKDNMSADLAKVILTHYPKEYNFLPNYIKYNEELALLALEGSVDNLKYIPDHFKTKEMCFSAIEKDACAVIGLPPELRKEEIYREVINVNAECIYHFPHEFVTRDLWDLALEKSFYNEKDKNLVLFRSIPYDDLKLKAIDSFPPDFFGSDKAWKLFNHKQEPDVIEDVVRKYPIMISQLNWYHKNDRVCRIAFEGDHRVLKYIPDEFKSAEMYLKAELSGLIVKVPDSVRKGNNIYSFYQEMKKDTSSSYFEIIKDFLSGKISLSSLEKSFNKESGEVLTFDKIKREYEARRSSSQSRKEEKKNLQKKRNQLRR